jgi:hypothetical protein
MSVFTALPQDMLQWEISRFLDPISRAEFNCVLQPDEHIYKKLPADYALTHHIRTVYNSYEGIAKMVNCTMWLTEQGGNRRFRNVRRFIRFLNNLLIFFDKPMNQIAIMYQKTLKDMLLRTWVDWLDDDIMVYDFIDEAEKEEIQKNARRAIATIEAIPFVRHIKIAGFNPVF